MFGELPKLLDRNYLIGFFLPAALLAGVAVWIANLFWAPSPLKLAELEGIAATAAAIGTVWVLSILLLAINFPVLRLMEGYGRWNPFGIRSGRWKAAFDASARPSLDLQADIEKARAGGLQEPERPDTHADQLLAAVELYPHEREFVLPTAFGNRFRAFEVYSQVVFGLDAIPAWPRLQAVLPSRYQGLLNGAKARLDFCVNILIAGVLTLLGFAAAALWTWRFPSILPPVVAAAAIIAGFSLSRDAASEFGTYVKAAFDLYRGELAVQLGLDLPLDPREERRMWDLVSRMMVYRSAARYDALAEFRVKPPTPSAKPKTGAAADEED